MVDFTRRTHIVRCAADPKDPDALFADVEVLDALAFRGPKGEELVLRFDPKDIEPFIVDDVGGGNEKSPNNGTRRSHMERIKSKDGGLIDVEVLDAIAFRGPGDKEWILNLPSKKSSVFVTNSREDSGEAPFTRRGHNEKISETFEKNPSSYMTITRTDEVAFRTIRNEEMVIKMPSNDDPNSSDPRALTFISSPQDYDPTNPSGPKPPLNTDKNVYVSFPSGASMFTGDEKIGQGMLWWIRKISGGEILFIQVDITRINRLTPVAASSNFGFAAPQVDLARVTDVMPPFVPDKDHPAEKLDLKAVNIWGSKNINNVPGSGTPPLPNPDHAPPGNQANNWTALFWINVSKVKKEHDKKIEFTLTIPKMTGATPGQGSGTGHYIWAVSGGDEFTYVPIHPPPDVTNAFSPYPFNDVTGVTNYIGLWNNGPFTSQQRVLFSAYGITQPPDPDAGGLGWSSAAGASAAAAALNAFGVADKAAAEAAAAANGIKIQFPPPIIYTTLTLDFSAGPSTQNPSCQVKVTAWDFVGKTSFPYTDKNVALFTEPKGKTAVKTLSKTGPSEPATITVTYDTAGLKIETA